jgi:hypothetical protein
MRVFLGVLSVSLSLLTSVGQAQIRPIAATPPPIVDSHGKLIGSYYNFYSNAAPYEGYTVFDIGDGRTVTLALSPQGFYQGTGNQAYYTSSDCSGTGYATTYGNSGTIGGSTWPGPYGIGVVIEQQLVYVTSPQQTTTIQASSLGFPARCTALKQPESVGEVAPLVRVAVLDNLFTPPFWLVTLSTPTFSPLPATAYSAATRVSLDAATTGAAIHYTTNGSTPTPSSPTYTGPIDVYENTTIKAIAVSTVGYTQSPVAAGFYGVLSAGVEFSPAAGSYSSSQQVSLTGPASVTTKIYYTTDGSTPTTASKVYTAEIPVSKTTTIKAIAQAEGFEPSLVSSATYTIY